MKISHCFSESYAAAREAFRAASRAAGVVPTAYHNSASGPAGEALTTDVAWFGPRDAGRLALTLSATHGAEGFAGSGIQVGLLASGLQHELPPDTALLLVHAINPYGFAWLRRVNEDNVDLNRNFIDHAHPPPPPPGYAELRDAICPPCWTPDALAKAQARLDDYARAHGAMALQSAITTGQYGDPEGVFYGGQAPVWSNRTLIAILREHAAHCRQVAFIDLHTGLGPCGYGEIMNNHAAGAPGHDRVFDWYGDEVTTIEAGSSSSAPVTGDTTVGVRAALPRAEVVGITLEYGTVPLGEVVTAVRADNWLHVHGEIDSPLGREIKAGLRAAFYPDGADWREMVLDRGIDVQRRAFRGLAG